MSKKVGFSIISTCLLTTTSQGFGQETKSEACAPNNGWFRGIEKFCSQLLAKQLKKLYYKNGAIDTHKLPRNVMSGLKIVRLGNFLKYQDTEIGPRYQLVLDESWRGKAYVNYHYAYTAELLLGGKYVEPPKAGEDESYLICGATPNYCVTSMISYYDIDRQLFDQIEAMPENTAIHVRVKRGGDIYLLCKNFISTGHFKALKEAIGQGSKMTLSIARHNNGAKA